MDNVRRCIGDICNKANISMTFVVDGAEVRQTKAGKDYLAVRIGDKTVSFFEAADVAVAVKQRRAISCDLK